MPGDRRLASPEPGAGPAIPAPMGGPSRARSNTLAAHAAGACRAVTITAAFSQSSMKASGRSAMATYPPPARPSAQPTSSQRAPCPSDASSGRRASPSAASQSRRTKGSFLVCITCSRWSAPRAATLTPSPAIRMSGGAAVEAKPAAMTIIATPLQRSGVLSRHSSRMPSVASSSGVMPNATMRPTAPGHDATHCATAVIQSMPRPMACQNTPSRPNGRASSPPRPAGMTHSEMTGIASRLATTP